MCAHCHCAAVFSQNLIQNLPARAQRARKIPKKLPVSGTLDQNLREICLTMYQLPLPSSSSLVPYSITVGTYYDVHLQLCVAHSPSEVHFEGISKSIWKVHATQRHTPHSSAHTTHLLGACFSATVHATAQPFRPGNSLSVTSLSPPCACCSGAYETRLGWERIWAKFANLMRDSEWCFDGVRCGKFVENLPA